jgi:hypothetical protein
MENAAAIKKYFKDLGISNIIPIFVYQFPEYMDKKSLVSNVLQGRSKNEEVIKKLETLKSIHEFNRKASNYYERYI